METEIGGAASNAMQNVSFLKCILFISPLINDSELQLRLPTRRGVLEDRRHWPRGLILKSLALASKFTSA